MPITPEPTVPRNENHEPQSSLPPRRQSRRDRPPGGAKARHHGLLIAAFLFLALGLIGWALAKGWVPPRVLNRLASVVVHRQSEALEWQPELPLTVLVMGLHAGGASTSPLTDSMLLVSLDPKTRAAGMLSVPRDLWVEIPGHGYGRVNEAYEDGGAQLAELAVEQAVGVPIQDYALISYSAFQKLVDDAGGVTVDVPRTLQDPTFPAPDEVHYEPFSLTAGVHQLNGRDALRYARERHGDPLGDLGRAARQQQIILALRDQLLRPASVARLRVMLADAQETVKTDFPLDELPALALIAANIPAANVKRDVLQYANQAVRDWQTPAGASVLLPNQTAVDRVVRAVFSPVLDRLDAGATVTVNNGAGYPGIATVYGKTLARMGVRVSKIGDAERHDYPRSQVQLYTRERSKVEEAHLLAGMLHVDPVMGQGQGPAEIVITLGRDYPAYRKSD